MFDRPDRPRVPAPTSHPPGRGVRQLPKPHCLIHRKHRGPRPAVTVPRSTINLIPDQHGRLEIQCTSVRREVARPSRAISYCRFHASGQERNPPRDGGPVVTANRVFAVCRSIPRLSRQRDAERASPASIRRRLDSWTQLDKASRGRASCRAAPTVSTTAATSRAALPQVTAIQSAALTFGR
jgi:hypothetical protein